MVLLPLLFQSVKKGEKKCVSLCSQLGFYSTNPLQWLNGVGISKLTADKWPKSLSMSFQYNLVINYTNWYCAVINIHLCCCPNKWEHRWCMQVCGVICLNICASTAEWNDFFLQSNLNPSQKRLSHLKISIQQSQGHDSLQVLTSLQRLFIINDCSNYKKTT